MTASLPDAAKSHVLKTTAILRTLVNLTDLIIIGQVRHPSGARRVMANSEEKESEIHAPRCVEMFQTKVVSMDKTHWNILPYAGENMYISRRCILDTMAIMQVVLLSNTWLSFHC